MARTGEEVRDRSDNVGNEYSSGQTAGAFVGGMIVGAAVGAAAGAIAGLLVAPQDGKETRKLLKQSADELPDLTHDVVTSVQFQTQQLAQSSLKGWEQTLLRLRTAITTGLSASQQERQRLAQSNQPSSSTSEPSDMSTR